MQSQETDQSAGLKAGIEWRAIFDKLWAGMTVPQASESLGYEWETVINALDDDVMLKRFCIDVCAMANYRDDEILCRWTQKQAVNDGDCI